ncbi:lysophospholipase 1 precursor [Ascoidea rubescens DSM 1968]|uniref:Lysophospholipase n=1 Tax=Ascoidea rubescens DSM 1968 TaxID=1344418 RepID=A0A1D2VFD0_9ASCO|nr:lysophospholipase 1 precursor [Ascoidea rubescens DSM 1968]ODV60388.1 lysophospholipase 1 precursor [Ascoidea rubescens DSM 1968]
MIFVILLSIFLIGVNFSNGWSPTNSFAPGKVSCPSEKRSFLRSSSYLNTEEMRWVEERNKITNANLKKFLKYSTSLEKAGGNFSVDDFFANYVEGQRAIKIGLAFSGGGYRAMLNGAGQLSAFDNRTTKAFEKGLGGLLESTTYISGLSGGSWLVGTLILNNWTSVEEILLKREYSDIWDLKESILFPEGINIFETIRNHKTVLEEVEDKRDAGYEISITDLWSRALAKDYLGRYEDYGDALTFSDVREFDVFKQQAIPFPIIVAVGRAPGTTIIDVNSTVVEMNPFEIGSWDNAIRSFFDIKYLGTKVSNGVAEDSKKCISGFDNASFLVGTSSSLFNGIVMKLKDMNLGDIPIIGVIEDILDKISEDENDIGVYKPNPFYQNEFGSSSSISNSDTLYLVDGGMDDQNIPLAPLIQQQRDVDLVVAFDNSADTDNNWPDGSSLVHTHQRQFGVQNNSSFPQVPLSPEEFVQQGLNVRPAFFGCDTEEGPLVVYIPNRQLSYASNPSTYKLKYSSKERASMVSNGFDVASRAQHQLDNEWATCLGCAAMRRTELRNSLEQPGVCQQCFERYCWRR